MSTDQEKPAGAGEFMLFGVRVVVDSMRKSVSLNNLSQYEHRLESSNANNIDKEKDNAAADGYASADDAVPRSSSATGGNRERKRGVPWTEEEHKLFLLGLQKVGKGDWRGISRNFVKTRTPTQVASHAQKYFLRRSNQNRRRRRSSLFDITTDTVSANPINGSGSQSPPPPPAPPASMESNSDIAAIRFSLPEMSEFPATPIYSPAINNQSFDSEMKLVGPLPVLIPPSSKSMERFDLNENSLIDSSPLSLNLSLSMSSDLGNSSPSSSSRRSAFQVMQGFSNGDSLISVA